MPALVDKLLIANPGSVIGCSSDPSTLQWTGTFVMFKALLDDWLNDSRAYRVVDKDNFLAQLEIDHPEAKRWLEREAPETWCRSHFDTTVKCEHIINNFSESFNKWILKIRDKPLHKAVQKLNMMMMTFMYERRNKAETWDQQGLVPRAVTHIEKMKKSYSKYDIAVCILVPMRRPGKKYCSKYYWVSSYVDTYADAIYAVEDESSWGKVRPPPLIRPAGRPRKKEKKDVDELNGNGGERKCGKCGMFGHNKKICKGPHALPQPPIRRPISRQDTPVNQRELRANMGFNITNNEPMSTRGKSAIRGGGRSGGRGSGRSSVGTGGRSSIGGRSSAVAGGRSSAAASGRSSATASGRSSVAVGGRSSAGGRSSTAASGRSSTVTGGRLSAGGRSSVGAGGRLSAVAGGRSSVGVGGRSRGRSSNNQFRGRGSYNAFIGEWFECSQGSGLRSSIEIHLSQTN
ncbi:hypothetical protein GIB67_034562 [Kingdonia uniflora]|uniref:CCHC-type domain-containing protein n=1 Tax=Kingdonia uniflora TaxID=39325 RepID=A0A7J7MXU1_9MAGN|nr:hypothetical protein GIB67_034562 [Kingdonia uniflora]